MKQVILSTLLLFGIFSLAIAQDEDTTYWAKTGVATIGFSNTGLSQYWQAGGFPSQTIIFRLNTGAKYRKANNSWANDLSIGYGLLRQGRSADVPFIKNEDRFEFNSKYGRRFSKKLLVSSLLNFRTQLAPGFAFDPAQPTAPPDTENPISRAFSPAYANLGVGLDYQPNDKLSVYYSPLTAKLTIVGDEDLRANYVPTEFVDNLIRPEVGSNLKVEFKDEIFKNVLFQTSGNFFTNYLAGQDDQGRSQFGNVDVNWETLTTAKVNSWLAITFATNLIYDDDIRFAIEKDAAGVTTKLAPRTQFQNILSVGITYTFLK